MKKQFLSLLYILSVFSFGQSFQFSSNGDLELRRFASGDTNFKTALSPILESSNYVLNLNYGNEFTGGVKINGKTRANEVFVQNFGGFGHIGFQTGNSFTYNGWDVTSLGLSRLGNELGVSALTHIRFFGQGEQFMVIKAPDGLVGIGTNNPDEKLTVKGKIHAEEVKVDLSVPADYVFEKYFTGNSYLKPDYEMLSLSEVESFVKENKHLPSIPSAKEIQENGLYLGSMNNLLLQKIEELTLYIIEQNKRIEELEAKVIDNN